jgi:single-strand DNA-binding protein
MGEWKDGVTLFLTCQVWRQAAENVAESLRRGRRVIGHRPPPPALLRDH